MQLNLVSHPATPPSDPAFKVWANVEHAGALGVIASTNIWFGVGAPASRFVMPQAEDPGSGDDLWQTTCFEAFLRVHGAEEYREWSGGRDWKDDFPEWEPVHRILFKNGIMGIENVGGDIDKVTGKRVTFAYFPWNWDRGDGCIVRLVAILDPKQKFRIEKGSKF